LLNPPYLASGNDKLIEPLDRHVKYRTVRSLRRLQYSCLALSQAPPMELGFFSLAGDTHASFLNTTLLGRFLTAAKLLCGKNEEHDPSTALT
jgi:hypothetical protein